MTTRLRFRNYKQQAWTYTNHSYSKAGEFHIPRDMRDLRDKYNFVEVHRSEEKEAQQ